MNLSSDVAQGGTGWASAHPTHKLPSLKFSMSCDWDKIDKTNTLSRQSPV